MINKLLLAPLAAAAVLVLGSCFQWYGEIDTGAWAGEGGSRLVRLADGTGSAPASRVAYTGNRGFFEENDEITVVVTKNAANNPDKNQPYRFKKTSYPGEFFIPEPDELQWEQFGASFDAYAFYPANTGKYVDFSDQSDLEKYVNAGYLYAAEQQGINRINYNNNKQFKFDHKTARVNVTLVPGHSVFNPQNAAVIFYGYTFGMTDPGATGDITPIAAIPQGEAAPVPASVPYGEITPYKDGVNRSAMMLPAVYDTNTTFLTATLGGKTYNWKPSEEFVLEAGDSYNLKVTLNRDGIDIDFNKIGPNQLDFYIFDYIDRGYESTDAFALFPCYRGGFAWSTLAEVPYANLFGITEPFYMGRYEIKQMEWEYVMGSNPSYYKYQEFWGDLKGYYEQRHGGWLPVDNVSWYEAIVFCNRLSMLAGLQPVYSVTVEGQEVNWKDRNLEIPDSNNDDWNNVTMDTTRSGFRLPTEAEWMWAFMGGGATWWQDRHTTKPYLGYLQPYAGDIRREAPYEYAWYNDNSHWYRPNNRKTTHSGDAIDVKSNGFGVRNMSGNVEEMCWDRFGDLPRSPAVQTNDRWVKDPSGSNYSGPQNPTTTAHVTKGGHIKSPPTNLNFLYRDSVEPWVKNKGTSGEDTTPVGFRVVCRGVDY